MSFDIGSTQALQATVASVRASGKASGAGAGGPVTSSEAVRIDTIPASPPPEVVDAMSVAAAAHDKLAASNRGISFKINDQTGKLVISVHDMNGNVLFTLPPSKALDIASGDSLEG